MDKNLNQSSEVKTYTYKLLKFIFGILVVYVILMAFIKWITQGSEGGLGLAFLAYPIIALFIVAFIFVCYFIYMILYHAILKRYISEWNYFSKIILFIAFLLLAYILLAYSIQASVWNLLI